MSQSLNLFYPLGLWQGPNWERVGMGDGGSMDVVRKSESCCYLLCGQQGSDLKKGFWGGFQGGGL